MLQQITAARSIDMPLSSPRSEQKPFFSGFLNRSLGAAAVADGLQAQRGPRGQYGVPLILARRLPPLARPQNPRPDASPP